MDFKGKQNILCDPDTVTLYGLRYLDSVHYRWIVHNPNSTLIDESGWNLHQVKFHIANSDTFDVTLIMTQNGKSDTMTRQNYVMLRECIPVADTRARWYFGQAEGHWFESSNSHINSQRVISLNTCNPFSFLNGLCFNQY
jgi:hypothetical protein